MSQKYPHNHKADPVSKDLWREASTCTDCGRPVTKVRATSGKAEHWQHDPRKVS